MNLLPRRLRELPSADIAVFALLFLALVLRVAAIAQKGVMYNDYIDAKAFVSSAHELLASGHYVFYGNNPSAHELPAFPLFLALIFRSTGNAFFQFLIMKVSFLAMSLATIYTLYAVGRRVGGPWVGVGAAAMLTVSLPNIYTGLLALSENLFALEVLLLTVMVFRLAEKPSWRRFVPLVIVFVVSLYTRQAALVILPAAVVYLWLAHYPKPMLFRQVAMTVLAVVLVMAPWWVRNYEAFHAFVPFQNMGTETMYEGTFQVFAPTPPEAAQAVQRIVGGFKGTEYELTQAFGDATRKRLEARWAQSPVRTLSAYLIQKPAAAWLLPHYWDEVLIAGSSWWVVRIHALVAVLGLAALAFLSVRSRKRNEFIFMAICVVAITLGTIVYLGLHKYVYPFMPFLYLAISYVVVQWVSALTPTTLPAMSLPSIG